MKIKRLLSVFLLWRLSFRSAGHSRAGGGRAGHPRQGGAAGGCEHRRRSLCPNIHEQNYPASLTKVMTALLILEKASGNDALLTQEVTAPESAFASPYYAADGSTAGIKAGEVLTVKQLLQCMLIVSANEACNILAEWHSGPFPPLWTP